MTLLPTTVVGSYSVPEWLERAEDRLPPAPDQRAAPERDPRRRDQGGAQGPGTAPASTSSPTASCGATTTSTTSSSPPARGGDPAPGQDRLLRLLRREVVRRCPRDRAPGDGLVADFRFTRELTRPAGQVLVHRAVLAVAPDPQRRLRRPGDLVRALARRLNARGARAGRGRRRPAADRRAVPGRLSRAGRAGRRGGQHRDRRRRPSTWALHVCYGNRYARPAWEGHYDFLFPAVEAARVDQLVLEFARKGHDDLRLLRSTTGTGLGLGVIDVKTTEVETPELVASRIRRALRRRARRPARRQPRLRAAPPAPGGGAGQAARHGRRGRHGQDRTHRRRHHLSEGFLFTPARRRRP